MHPGKVGSRRILIWQRRTLKKSRARSGKRFGGFARSERAVVGAGGGQAGVVDGNAARHEASRIGVAQADLENRGRAEPHHLCVALGKKLLGVLVVGEGLFESASQSRR